MYLLYFGLTIVSPFICFIVSTYRLKTNSSNWRFYILFIALAVGTIAFYTNTETDLTSYYGMINGMDKVSLWKSFNYFDDELYAKNFFFWICNRLECNQLLPFTAAGVTYYCILYTTGSVSEYFEKREYIFWIAILQFLFLPFSYILDIARSHVAYSIISVACVRDLLHDKRDFWTIALYLIPCGIHDTAVAFIILRIVFFIRDEIGLWTYFTPIISLTGISFIHRITENVALPGFLEKIINKTYGYISGETVSGWQDTVANSPWQNTNRYIFLIAGITFLLIIINYLHDATWKSKGDFRLYKYGIVITLVTIIINLIIEGDAHRRFETIFISFFSIILIPAIENNKIHKSVVYVIALFGLMLTTLQIYQSIENYMPINWITNASTNGLLHISIQIIRGLF